MRTTIKSLVTALAVACIVQTCTVGFVAPNLPRTVATPPAVHEARQFVRPAAPEVSLDNADGSVTVYTHSANTVEARVDVKIYTRQRGLDAEAQDYADKLIQVADRDGALQIVTEPHERPDDLELFANYTIYVPAGTNLKLRSANGNVWVAKGCGAVDVQGRNTDVSITGPQGKVFARSTNGRIRVVDAADGADLKTVNGNVYAHVIHGSLDATTTNGVIVARLLRPDVDKCNLNTRNGGITVVMSDGCSAKLEARTARGIVTSDLPVDASQGVKRRRHVRGIVGAGHTALTMDTLNGNIWITRSGS